MNTDLVVREQRPYELTEKQVTIISNTEFVPKEKRGKHDVIWASIFHGRSIGIDDMTAIQKIHIINGAPALAATLASGIAAQRGHKIEGEMSVTSATARGERGDNGAKMSVTFTIEDAQAAGLAGKQVYKQHPQSMLWARAVTQLCRSLFPDCFIGGVYTREELGEDVIDDDDVIDGEATVVPDGLGESVSEQAGEAKGASVDGSGSPASTESSVHPGSPSPSIDDLCTEFGRETVAAAYRDVFPRRNADPLSNAELKTLADRLRQGVLV